MTGRIAAMSTQRSISTTPGATSSSSSVTSVTGIFFGARAAAVPRPRSVNASPERGSSPRPCESGFGSGQRRRVATDLPGSARPRQRPILIRARKQGPSSAALGRPRALCRQGIRSLRGMTASNPSEQRQTAQQAEPVLPAQGSASATNPNAGPQDQRVAAGCQLPRPPNGTALSRQPR